MIDKILGRFILIAQAALTFMLLMVIYTIVVLLYTDFGVDGVVGLLIFHPLMGAILSLSTIAICYFIGLPLRRNDLFRNWWKRNYRIVAVLAGIGVLLIILSMFPGLSETATFERNGIQVTEKVPNTLLAVSGWFLAAFMCLHIFPQQIIDRRLQKMMDDFGDTRDIEEGSYQELN